jgi:hypothetical protein
MPMKTLKPFVLAATLLASLPANAQTIDLAAMKCADYLQASQENVTLITTWLVGLYTDIAEPRVIDRGRLRSSGEKLADFCRKNPNFSISTAADGLLGD